MSDLAEVFTMTSAFSLAGVILMVTIAYLAANAFLPKGMRWQDRYIFIWLAFDALIHFIFEGSWLSLSMFGRQVNTSVGPFADMWREYTKADARWGVADPTVVSLEILTVVGGGPLACYILYKLIKNDPARHYWVVVLCTAEIYGGWMTFCPEWLTGSKGLSTDNVLHLWVYLFLMNFIWVIVPFLLMVDSYTEIASSLRAIQTTAKGKKAH